MKDTDYVRAPIDNIIVPSVAAVANDFGVLKFTVTTTHAANALPDSWSGKYVNLVSPVEVDFAFSHASNAEVDTSVTATAAGASVKVGGKLLAGERRHVRLPLWDPNQNVKCYFVREAGSSSAVYVELSSTS